MGTTRQETLPISEPSHHNIIPLVIIERVIIHARGINDIDSISLVRVLGTKDIELPNFHSNPGTTGNHSLFVVIVNDRCMLLVRANEQFGIIFLHLPVCVAPIPHHIINSKDLLEILEATKDSTEQHILVFSTKWFSSFDDMYLTTLASHAEIAVAADRRMRLEGVPEAMGVLMRV